MFPAVTLLALALAPGAENFGHDHLGYRSDLRWQQASTERTARGLFLYEEAQETGVVGRVLAETPAGRRVVVTETLDFRRGTHTLLLVEEETGWWARLVKRYRFRGDSLWEYLEKGYEHLTAEGGETLIMHLETHSGLQFEAEVPATNDPTDAHRAFVEALGASGLREKLASEIPDELWGTVRFLGGAFAAEGGLVYNSLPIPELLLLAADENAESGWQQSASDLRRGLDMTEEAEASFVSRFESLEDPHRPLSGHRLFQVLAKSDE